MISNYIRCLFTGIMTKQTLDSERHHQLDLMLLFFRTVQQQTDLRIIPAIRRIGIHRHPATQGAGASNADKCYARLVFDWWSRTYPQASFRYVNAGIGATTSTITAGAASERSSRLSRLS